MFLEKMFSVSTKIAIEAPDRQPLNYIKFKNLIKYTETYLISLGLKHSDIVAIVLPNGPVMATAFFSVANFAIAAPLNPTFTETEFLYYLNDIQAKAIIVSKETPEAARNAAYSLDLLVLNLVETEDAGGFKVESESKAKSLPTRLEKKLSDTCLILHTSGTTSKPKIVPLSIQNLLASASNISKSLKLRSSDRCLNIMPLFHIHALIAVLLASIKVNSTIICSSGFNALKFFALQEKFKPTWYSAVPTMHQAILARASRNQRIINEIPLRLIRSSSASLPHPILLELERTFRCPVIEAYGMTEAAHQMASNPLPPKIRKPGTVGVATGLEISLLDQLGAILHHNQVGEICIRGANVIEGYKNNENANKDSFTNGWFRTGDQGILDEDGYLTIVGRIKEIINRGGEKVSPREVDDVILENPYIAQAVTFAVPHEKLGEEVACAIVLKKGKVLSEKEVINFAKVSLSKFKVPKKIIFLDEIPKGPTGKLQRIGLARVLGLETNE